METMLKILPLILPLIGVVIGGCFALLNPWLNNRLAKAKRKRELKTELIQGIALIFNYFESEYARYNLYYINFALAESFKSSAYNHDEGSNQFQLALKNHDMYETSHSQYHREYLSTSEKSAELEARILALLAELSFYYRKKTADEVNELIIPKILQYSSTELLYKYDQLKHDELISLIVNLSNELEAGAAKIKKARNHLLNDVQKALT